MANEQITSTLIVRQKDSGIQPTLPAGSVTNSQILAGVSISKIQGVAAGSLLFTGAAPGLAVSENNSKLFWDNANFRFGVGISAPTTTLHMRGTDISSQFERYTTSVSAGSALVLAKSNSATIGTQTALANGDFISRVTYQASDGTAFQSAAQVDAQVDAAVSTGIVPGRLVLSTANASGVLTERLRISNDGTLSANNVSGANAGLTIASASSGAAGASLALNNTSTGGTSFFMFSSDSGSGLGANRLGMGVGSIGTSNSKWIFDSTGHFGVGVTPVTLLDVNGDFAIRSQADAGTQSGTRNNVSTANISFLEFNVPGTMTITGFANPANGKIVHVSNIGVGTITFSNQNAGSSAGNKFDMIGDLTMTSRGFTSFIYSAQGAAWYRFRIA